MYSCGEFIRGYTEMIVLSILDKQDDYVYNISNTINAQGGGLVTITNPSLLIVLKKMHEDGKVSSFNVLNEKNVNRKFYTITDRGREYYSERLADYLASLEALKRLLKGEEK